MRFSEISSVFLVLILFLRGWLVVTAGNRMLVHKGFWCDLLRLPQGSNGMRDTLTAAEDLTHQPLEVFLDASWVLWLPSSFQRCLFPEYLSWPYKYSILHGSSHFSLSVGRLLGLQLMEGVKRFVKVRLYYNGKSFFLSVLLIVLKSKKLVSTNKQHLCVISISHLQDGTHSSG